MTDPFSHYLSLVSNYLDRQDFSGVARLQGRRFTVTPLAKGEYNLNYLLQDDQGALVFRVNMGTQIARDDQILYEYRTLALLAPTGLTPQPLFVDDSRQLLDRGILIMEYLPGRHLCYENGLDLQLAARLFADLHQLQPESAPSHLIVEDQPLSLIFAECAGLLQHYFDSELAVPEIRSYLLELRDWAAEARAKEAYYQQDPWFAVVNTEVNSGNFLVDEQRKSIRLVDWEMARWGDPSTDLCHFLSPLTTLWKTDWQADRLAYASFLGTYRSQLRSSAHRDSLDERMRLKYPFVCLRGISWSAMAWVAYQHSAPGIRNEDTARKLESYLQLPFIRTIFDPFLRGA